MGGGRKNGDERGGDGGENDDYYYYCYGWMDERRNAGGTAGRWMEVFKKCVGAATRKNNTTIFT
jgi:hypothetical protein